MAGYGNLYANDKQLANMTKNKTYMETKIGGNTADASAKQENTTKMKGQSQMMQAGLDMAKGIDAYSVAQTNAKFAKMAGKEEVRVAGMEAENIRRMGSELQSQNLSKAGANGTVTNTGSNALVSQALESRINRDAEQTFLQGKLKKIGLDYQAKSNLMSAKIGMYSNAINSGANYMQGYQMAQGNS